MRKGLSMFINNNVVFDVYLGYSNFKLKIEDDEYQKHRKT